MRSQPTRLTPPPSTVNSSQPDVIGCGFGLSTRALRLDVYHVLQQENEVNIWELVFAAVAGGIGAGLGIAVGRTHGLPGFILGFLGGLLIAFLLLGFVLVVAPKSARRLAARDRNKEKGKG